MRVWMLTTAALILDLTPTFRIQARITNTYGHVLVYEVGQEQQQRTHLRHAHQPFGEGGRVDVQGREQVQK